MEWNARRVLTLWSGTTSINDYARKEWAGMLSSFYLKRWQWFLEEQGKALREKQALRSGSFQIVSCASGCWPGPTKGRGFLQQPRGDSVAISKKLVDRYSEVFHPDALSLTTGKPTTCSPRPAVPIPSTWQTTVWLPMPTASGPPTSTDTQARSGGRWISKSQRRLDASLLLAITVTSDTTVSRSRLLSTARPGVPSPTTVTTRNRRRAAGYACVFAPRPVRYLRVTQPYNSANSGRHLVEVMAFEK